MPVAFAVGIGTSLVVASVLIVLAGKAMGTIGPNVVVNTPGFVSANNSPTIIRNPGRSDNLVVVHRIDQPPYSASLEWTIDSGRTWRAVTLPLPPGSVEPYAPDAAFAPDGTLYVSYVSLQGTGHVPDNLWVARSVDGGRTLSEPIRVAGPLVFQARLVAGTSGLLHVTWLQASVVGLFSISGRASIVSATSRDYGRQFSAPVQVSDPQRELVGAATPIIDSEGHLVVLYEDFKRDQRDFENLDGPVWDQPLALVVTRSNDNGRSFSAGKEVDSRVMAAQRFVVYLPEFPSLAAGPHRSLYVVWGDNRSGDEDVLLRRSDDGGESWTAPARVNQNRLHDGTNQSLPQVAVASNGRVDVLFIDGAGHAAGAIANVSLASSGDRGGTFKSVRMTSRPFNTEVGPQKPRGGADFGSRLGLSSENGRVFAAWTDSRLGNQFTHRQDVVFALLSRENKGRPNLLWPLAAGLVAATALLALGRFRRDGLASDLGDSIARRENPVACAEGG